MCKLIEVSGTPDAGKTTTIDMVKSYLISRNFPVIVIGEARGKTLPPKDSRKSLLFNIWVGTSAAESILSAKEKGKNNEIIIVDRGLIDYQFWVYYYFKKGKCSKQEAEEALSMDIFTNKNLLPDLFIGMTTSVDEAIKRSRSKNNTVSLEFHNKVFTDFFKTVTVPKYLLDTTYLSPEETTKKFLELIEIH